MGKDNHRRRSGGGGSGSNGRNFDIQPGMTGVMVTCGRQQEARCTSEILQLLEKVLEEDGHLQSDDRLQGEGQGLPQAKSTSFADEIAKEVAQLRNASARPFQAIGTGEVSCIVFIKLAPSAGGDPVKLVGDLFRCNDSGAEHSARFCQRIIPLNRIFKASLESLKVEASFLFESVFHKSDGLRHTYAIIFESRLSQNLDRKTTISMLADMIGTRHKVDLENPELIVMVQVFKGVCGISILPKYNEFKKYNIQEFHRAHQQK